VVSVQPRTSEIERIVRPFVQALLAKAPLLKDFGLTDKQRARVRNAMAYDLRQCADVVTPSLRPPEVSVAAARLAAELGIDLAEQSWHTMGSAHRKTFHFEHVYPLTGLALAVARRPDLDTATIFVVERLWVAWITSDENRELNRRTYRSIRPDPAGAYRAAEIELVGGNPSWPLLEPD
jgi:hypothetical protein